MSTTLQTHWWRRRRGRLQELSREECVQSLASCRVGRVAFWTVLGPRLVPMNYALHADAVWLSTSTGSELARVGLGQQVAFEVDDLDDFLESGWSVLVVGVAEAYEGSFAVPVLEPLPDSWAEGHDEVIVVIRWQQLSGRRLLPP